MKTLLHVAAAAALSLTASAEVKVVIGNISDKRTTGKFFSGLDIELKLSGPDLVQAKGIRTTVKSITDDAGNPVPAAENRFQSDGFDELQKAFGRGFGAEKKADEFQVKLEFSNPPRTARSIKQITGSIELLIPQRDPASTITASVAKDGGKPLENAALKAAGVEFTLLKPGATEKKPSVFSLGGTLGKDDLGYEIKDPKNKIASVEFFDASGGKLETQGRMSSGFNNSKTVTINFKNPPPADAIAKIYVVTEKSVLTVPLDLKDVPLP